MKKDVDGSLRRGRGFITLRRREAFKKAYRSTRRHRRGNVIVITSEGEPGLPQVGFVVGKRNGKAAERNRVKRRLREAMARMALENGTAYLVIAQPGEPRLAVAEFEEIVRWLRSAIELGKEQLEKRK